MANQDFIAADDEDNSGHGPVSEFQLTEEMMQGLNMRDTLKRTRQAAFLRAFAIRGVTLDGLKAANIPRSSFDSWKSTDPWFEGMCWQALEEAKDRIEAEAHRRAVDGYDELVIYQGMPTEIEDPHTGQKRLLTVRKYSDALLQTLLKGARPDKYRENHKIEHTGQVTQGVLVVPGAISVADWSEQARIQQEKFAGSSDDN